MEPLKVDNQLEQDFIVAIMKIHPDYWIWLGGSYVETEERFVWNHSGRPAGQEYRMNCYLVEVDNQFEQDFIFATTKIHHDYLIWLGGSYVETEEKFVWNHSGRPAGQEYFAWYELYPVFVVYLNVEFAWLTTEILIKKSV